ncbi:MULTISPECIES: c-type cytochrome biogenesis protein CcmI [unclassified Neptuniibacter]|uniref:c-type cytochrome biogenesis protein CcmI n=1 Tax=unclassified Neptuniibacter TaxID=2630693 RepID=UPI000C50E453|nr:MULTISPECIES: c-type cytochrome biogenesis protein CcmI [unclassified Neptuniibacter]MAY42188.1 c-type cytochrome biogenesis protein CcmI [Oceanospirillaceae bacterium]
MIELWVGIAALTILAIAFVVLPFVRAKRLVEASTDEDRSQQNIEIFRERLAELENEKAAGNLEESDFLTLKTELERNLLSDVQGPESSSGKLQLTSQVLTTVMLLASMIPVAGIGLYSSLGRSADLEIALQQPKDPFNGQVPTLEQAIAQLEKELEMNPDNAEGWFLLSTTYMNQGRYKEGAAGFKKILTILPADAPQYASVNGQYAQALFFAEGSKITDGVRAQIDKTLEIEPLEITVLGLLGIDAYEKQDYEAALEFWLTALRNADGQTADSLRSGAIKARDRLIEQGTEVAPIPELEIASISLKVDIDPSLKGQVSPEQTIFVFAREVGQRMPLAAVKLSVSDLPANVVLDDTMAMSPEATLSSAAAVEVSARISLSGQPQAKAGDLYGIITPVDVRGGDLPLQLIVDKVVE